MLIPNESARSTSISSWKAAQEGASGTISSACARLLKELPPILQPTPVLWTTLSKHLMYRAKKYDDKRLPRLVPLM